jgi:hypothetical protein
VTLKPRFNPDATGPAAAHEHEDVDRRQAAPFAAAWTLGALRNLACGGAASITFYETSGPRGLRCERGPYPLYHLFEALAPHQGGECAPAARAGALWLRRERKQAMMVANLTAGSWRPPAPAGSGAGGGRVRLCGGGPEPYRGVLPELPPWGIAILEWERS